MRQLQIVVPAVVIVGAGVSAVFVANLRQSGAQQQASTSQASLSIASVKQTTTITVNASNGPDGCGPLSATTYDEGYNLTVYYSSSSLKIGDTECIAANIEDASGVPVPAKQSLDFSLTFTVTDSQGNIVMNSIPCIPTGTVLPGQGPAQGFSCADSWETGLPVNGSLAPGTYHIGVIGYHDGPSVVTPLRLATKLT
jgi:hypothetical protein